jgi:peptide/nickel transport system substrate-binding protein
MGFTYPLDFKVRGDNFRGNNAFVILIQFIYNSYMRSFRSIMMNIIMISLLTFFVGCDSSTPLPSSKKNQVLILNLGADPSNFNPVLSTDSVASTIESRVFNGLLKMNDDLELELDLAESYRLLDDGLRYRFHLKKGVKWHDGHPFTAHDVKYTFEIILNPKTNTVRRSNFVIGGKPLLFNVIDTHTIDIVLPELFSPALIRLSSAIIPKHILEKVDINKAAFNRHPIGTGPFRFVAYKSGQFVKLTRNDHYFGQRPKLTDILFKVIPDNNTAVLSFEKGELDSSSIPPKEKKRFQSKSQMTLYSYTPLSYTYLGFNLKHRFFKDSKVRQAIAYAINKNALLNGVLKGQGKVANIPSSPVLWSYPKNESFPTYDYNPQKSEQLLQEAGFVKNKAGVYEKEGDPFEFLLLTNKGNKEREKTAKIIQQFLKKVGITMSIRIMEWSSFLKIVNSLDDPKPYDAVILGWSLGIDPDSYSIWHSSQYPKGFNFIGYNNKTVDQLLIAGRREMDKEKRKVIYHQLYGHIARDVPYLFLFFPEATVGIYDYVKGLSKPGPAGLFNTIESIYMAN